jgi:selenium-binding protein 1
VNIALSGEHRRHRIPPNCRSRDGRPRGSPAAEQRDELASFQLIELHSWDNQFYPDGVPGAQVMANASPNGGLELAKEYWVSFPEGYRAHQIRLEGGDCSTDSFCYPSA